MKRRIVTLVSAVTAMVMLSGCSLFLYDDESSSTVSTTTASKTDRNRTTTTNKVYIVEEEEEYTTTTKKNSSEDVNPDALERVSVSTTKKKKGKDDDIVLTTTTTAKLAGKLKLKGKKPLLVACDEYRPTAKLSQYNTLQLPKNDEYFDITKQYRTSKETELRYGPSGEYTSQLSLKQGESLSCYGKSGKWYYALYDNNTYGWVEESALEGIAKKTTTKKN